MIGAAGWSGSPAPTSRMAAPASVRASVKALGGHATLCRAPDHLRRTTDVFEPPSEPLAALSRRLKEAFDPAGVLNPGRLYPGV